MKSVSILGSTGSIGTSTVDLLLQDPAHYRVVALVGGSNADTGVAHFEQHLHVWAFGIVQPDHDHDLAELGELHRVTGQIEQYLTNAAGVAAEDVGNLRCAVSD